MKKEELKRIIESRLIIRNYYGKEGECYGTALKDFEKKYVNYEEVILTEDEWFPQIDDIEAEIEALKNEIRNTINQKNEAVSYLESYKCTHPVRISNCSDRGLNWYNTDTCVLCGKMMDTTVIKRKDINAFDQRRQKFSTFIGKEIISEGGFGADSYIRTNYTEGDILNILLDMLDKIEEDEFDLVDEIEKLKFDKCIINKPHNKKLILVIIGSNKEYINNNAYFTSKNNIDDKKIVDDLLELYGVAIEVIGDMDTIKKYKTIDETLMLDDYDSIENLNVQLQYQHNVPYSLIIDASDLYTYKICNGKIEVEKYNLNLKSMFPNIPIINSENFFVKPTNIIDVEQLNSLVKKAIKNSANLSDESSVPNISSTYVDKDDNLKHTEAKQLVKNKKGFRVI